MILQIDVTVAGPDFVATGSTAVTVNVSAAQAAATQQAAQPGPQQAAQPGPQLAAMRAALRRQALGRQPGATGA